MVMACHSEAEGRRISLPRREYEIPFGLALRLCSGQAQGRLRLRGVYPEQSEGLRLRMTPLSTASEPLTH